MSTFFRKEIGNGVFFSKITDSRYKLNRIGVYFLTELDKDSAAINAVVPRILVKSSAQYPTFSFLTNKLSSLYAARVNDIAGKLGDSQYLGLSLTAIDDAYALENEKLTAEVTDILLGCLFNPLLENGVFSEKVTGLEKQSLIDDIEAEINDKISYARNKAYSLLCDGEPASVPASGTAEKAQEITAQNAYEAYKKLLTTCPVEIICAGCNDFTDAEKLLTDAFAKLDRKNIKTCGSDLSKLKAEVLTSVEKLPVSQSKMVIGFKTDCKNHAALTVMSALYGGTTTSKLFMNVREKLSLCYYCWSAVNRDKGVMTVSSGIENKNIEKAKTEILAQLDAVKAGDFTDDDIIHSKLSLENDLKGVKDSPRGISDWYFANIYKKRFIEPAEYIEQINAVSREDIVSAASSVKLDSVYILTSDKEESEAEAE